MRKDGVIPKEEKWNAVINCDRSYDGLFYYGVKTTGVFCRPSCRSKAPLKDNVSFFNSSDVAKKEGYRPCKICRPDINENIYEPNKELLEVTEKKLKESYFKAYDFKAISQELSISASHLTRLFKAYYKVTPKAYVIQIRIDESIKLLVENKLDILEVAYEVGFESISSFYKYFKDKVGCTPREYRKVNNHK